jgi:hypothetical protein
VSHSNTSLRKYVATVIQVMDLPDYQKEWVARFLGHKLHVNYDFYRQDPVVVNLAKMSKLMLLVDQGVVKDAEGLDLNNVDYLALNKDDFVSDDLDLEENTPPTTGVDDSDSEEMTPSTSGINAAEGYNGFPDQFSCKR